MMHLGSFDEEPATVALMDAYLGQNGYVNDMSKERFLITMFELGRIDLMFIENLRYLNSKLQKVEQKMQEVL